MIKSGKLFRNLQVTIFPVWENDICLKITQKQLTQKAK